MFSFISLPFKSAAKIYASFEISKQMKKNIHKKTQFSRLRKKSSVLLGMGNF
jgi:hypothetical protein